MKAFRSCEIARERVESAPSVPSAFRRIRERDAEQFAIKLLPVDVSAVKVFFFFEHAALLTTRSRTTYYAT